MTLAPADPLTLARVNEGIERRPHTEAWRAERLTSEQVPPVPDEPERRGAKGDYVVIDNGLERWRFRYGELVVYIRYRSHEERDFGAFPWEKIWISPGYR